jgi:hypothetical protein
MLLISHQFNFLGRKKLQLVISTHYHNIITVQLKICFANVPADFLSNIDVQVVHQHTLRTTRELINHQWQSTCTATNSFHDFFWDYKFAHHLQLKLSNSGGIHENSPKSCRQSVLREVRHFRDDGLVHHRPVAWRNGGADFGTALSFFDLQTKWNASPQPLITMIIVVLKLPPRRLDCIRDQRLGLAFASVYSSLTCVAQTTIPPSRNIWTSDPRDGLGERSVTIVLKWGVLTKLHKVVTGRSIWSLGYLFQKISLRLVNIVFLITVTQILTLLNGGNNLFNTRTGENYAHWHHRSKNLYAQNYQWLTLILRSFSCVIVRYKISERIETMGSEGLARALGSYKSVSNRSIFVWNIIEVYYIRPCVHRSVPLLFYFRFYSRFGKPSIAPRGLVGLLHRQWILVACAAPSTNA